MLEHAVDAALVLAFLDGLTLVILAFASSKRDDQLGKAPLVDKQTQGHDGDTGLLGVTGNASDFLTVEQQFAVTVCRVVVVGAVTVLCDIHVLDPDFAVDDHAVGVGQTALALTYGFNLGTREHNARSEGLDDLIIERRLAVLDIDCIMIVALSHRHILSEIKLQTSPE